jgi:NADH-quinone oxidoreductase subunit N
MAGLAFKVAAAPFHMWAPDVYEGAPLPVTAYLAIGSTTAAFALILRLAAEGFLPAGGLWSQWQLVVAVLAAVSMLVGNLVALAQHNIKRLMAYSSIGHTGFILAGVAALTPDSPLASNAVMLYLAGYAVTNLVVFAGIIAYFNRTGRELIADFAGLAGEQPFLAAAIAIGLFSLGGLPIFAGFAIKFYLFIALAESGFLWLAGLAIFSSLISLYYYLQIIRQMYIEPGAELSEAAIGDVRNEAVPDQQREPPEPVLTGASWFAPPGLLLGVLAVGLLAVVLIGVYPAPLLDLIEAASQAILPGV